MHAHTHTLLAIIQHGCEESEQRMNEEREGGRETYKLMMERESGWKSVCVHVCIMCSHTHTHEQNICLQLLFIVSSI